MGMVTLVRPLQPRNAELPIEVTELGIIVFLHPLINVFVADQPISVTELGMVTLVKPSHSRNA